MPQWPTSSEHALESPVPTSSQQPTFPENWPGEPVGRPNLARRASVAREPGPVFEVDLTKRSTAGGSGDSGRIITHGEELDDLRPLTDPEPKLRPR